MKRMTAQRSVFDFHFVSLLAFLIYLNFVLQRIELPLNDKLQQFPFSYVYLLVLFLLLIVNRKTVFDRKIRSFSFVVFFLIIVSLLSLLINELFNSTPRKRLWFQLLSMVYVYVPIVTGVYVYLITDSIRKFEYLLKIFCVIVLGQIIVGFLMLSFTSYLEAYMGWSQAEYAAVRSTSTLIGGTGPLAFLFMITIPLTFSLYIIRGGICKLMVLGMVFASWLLTYSRGPLILGFVCVAIMSLFLLVKHKKVYIHKRILICVVLSVCTLFIALLSGKTPINMDYLFRKDVGHADSARITSAKTALTLAMDRPLLGYGPGQLYIRNYEQVEDKHIMIFGMHSLKTPHNLYLLFAAENGFFSVFFWGILFLVLIKSVSIPRKSLLEHKIISIGFASLITLAFVYSIITDQLATQYRFAPTFWFLVGLGMAFSKLSSECNHAQAAENVSAERRTD